MSQVNLEKAFEQIVPFTNEHIEREGYKFIPHPQEENEFLIEAIADKQKAEFILLKIRSAKSYVIEMGNENKSFCHATDDIDERKFQCSEDVNQDLYIQCAIEDYIDYKTKEIRMKNFKELVNQIQSFDPYANTVDQLRDWIKNASEILDEDGEGELQDFVDLTSLNSKPFPDCISGYPTWAMDHNNNCLVGEDLQTIEHYDDIAIHYAKKHNLEVDND